MTGAERARRAAIAIAGATAFLNLYATQALLPDLARDFQASETTVGLTVTMGTLAVALTAPLIGALADKLGRKRIIVAAAFLVAVPTALTGAAHTMEGLLAWRFLQGLVLPAIFAVTVAYVGEEYPRDQAAGITGLYIGATTLGGFMGRFLTAHVAELTDWRTAFLVLALVDLACAAAIWRWLPPARNFRPSPQIGTVFRGMASHLRDRRLLATFAIGASVLFSLVAVFTYVNFLLAGPAFGLGIAQLGNIFAVYLVGAFLSPLTGRIIARIGRRGLIAAAIAAAWTGLVITLLPALSAVVLGLALFAGGVFLIQSAATAQAGATAHARSAAVGLYATCYYLGGSLGGVAPGPLWQSFGWPACVTLVALVLAGTGFLAFRFWPAD